MLTTRNAHSHCAAAAIMPRRPPPRTVIPRTAVSSNGALQGLLGSPRVAIVLPVFVAALVAHAVYVVATRFTRTITVRRLYTGVETESTSSGYYSGTTYMLTDTQGRVYQVSNSFWLWSWDKERVWSSMEEGRTYVVHGYGAYHSALGMYAHVVDATTVPRR